MWQKVIFRGLNYKKVLPFYYLNKMLEKLLPLNNTTYADVWKVNRIPSKNALRKV